MRAPIMALTAVAAAIASVAGINNGDVSPTWENSSTSVLGRPSSTPVLSKVGRLEAGPTVLAQAEQPGGTQPVVVDESALRYFAAQGDNVRLQAEIARLRALHPGWTPPSDPLAAAKAGDPKVQALWDLFAATRYDDVDRAIADRQKEEPGWAPPADLVESLNLARTRQRLVQASDAGDSQKVIDLAAQSPSLLTCENVDALWRLAEAFTKQKQPDRARDAYGYVLENCSDAGERLATVQKAGLLLDAPRLDSLLRLERQGTDGKPEFESIRDDLARSVIARGGQDTGAEAVIPAGYVERLETIVNREGKASDALLLGWYFYRRDNFDTAEKWFRNAYEKQKDAASAQGLALVRINQDDPGDAENILYGFRDENADVKAAYLASVTNLLALDPPRVIDNSVLARMAPPVISARNVAAAEQFGWYARLVQQMGTAADWFGLVLSWDATYEPAAYGLAVSLDALSDKTGVARVQSAWAGRSERIANLHDRKRSADLPPLRVVEPPVLPVHVVSRSGPRSIVQQAENNAIPVDRKQTRQSGCRQPVEAERLAPGDALSRGWCLMELGRPVHAVAAFDRALAAGDPTTRQDAAYGKSLAYLRLKLTDKAAVAASAVPQSPKRAKELQTAILTDRAIGAFRASRYNEAIIALDQRGRLAPERQDLMLLRGFAYMKLGYKAEAIRIFQALANAGNNAAISALADLNSPSG